MAMLIILHLVVLRCISLFLWKNGDDSLFWILNLQVIKLFRWNIKLLTWLQIIFTTNNCKKTTKKKKKYCNIKKQLKNTRKFKKMLKLDTFLKWLKISHKNLLTWWELVNMSMYIREVICQIHTHFLICLQECFVAVLPDISYHIISNDLPPLSQDLQTYLRYLALLTLNANHPHFSWK